MNNISGLKKEGRKQLTKILRGTKGTISVTQAAEILELPRNSTAKLLAWWTRQGWLSRVKRGIYVPIPLDATSPDIVFEDPWIVAERLYSPCYIGGWSAAEYWGLTEQIFRTIVVMTTQKPRSRRLTIKGTDFLLRTIPSNAMFGMTSVWRGQVKVNISDQARTIIDIFNSPDLGGGLRPAVDIFRTYMTSKEKKVENLIEYAQQLGNGAVIKRLGFLSESFFSSEIKLIQFCKTNLTKGNSKLDPSMPADRLVTAWHLWVPQRWVKESGID
jgi:predicted transcriptional regulator of viral defense system